MTAKGDPLERAYSELDQLPAALFAPVVVNPVGALEGRVRGVLQWRAALLRGVVPLESDWPGPAFHSALCTAVTSLGVLPFTPGEPELVEVILIDLVGAVADLAAVHEDRMGELLAAAKAKTRQQWEEEPASRDATGGGTSTEVDGSSKGEARGGGDDDAGSDLGASAGYQESGEAPGGGAVDPSHADRLQDEARLLADGELLTALSDRLDGRWADRVASWRRLADVLGDLKLALALGFDLGSRVLRHTGWREVDRLQQLLVDLPQVHELVRALGRMNAPRGQDQASVLEEVVDPVRRVVEELRWIRSPRAPTEARGIERGDDIARMLPVEASLLSRPSLRLLWHARRAEAGLAVYRYEGKLAEKVLVQTASSPTERSSHELPERGPVVVCLDTSGSMQGAPEQVAKALVLAVARAAHDEGRACQVVLFSGPGDVEAIEVDLGPDGIGGLLDLLARSFHGGTDVDAPLQIALDILDRQGWNRADLLLVSDGAFDVAEALVAQAQLAVDRHHARIHGLLIGVQPSPSMQSLCDPLHVFADWAGVGGVDGRG